MFKIPDRVPNREGFRDLVQAPQAVDGTSEGQDLAEFLQPVKLQSQDTLLGSPFSRGVSLPWDS